MKYLFTLYMRTYSNFFFCFNMVFYLIFLFQSFVSPPLPTLQIKQLSFLFEEMLERIINVWYYLCTVWRTLFDVILIYRSQSESPVSRNSQEPTAEIPARRISLLSRPFGLGWRDRNKVIFINHCGRHNVLSKYYTCTITIL